MITGERRVGLIQAGGNNVFVGYSTGTANTTGSHNAGLGYKAGYSNSTGSYNTMIGDSAGYKSQGAKWFCGDTFSQAPRAGCSHLFPHSGRYGLGIPGR